MVVVGPRVIALLIEKQIAVKVRPGEGNCLLSSHAGVGEEAEKRIDHFALIFLAGVKEDLQLLDSPQLFGFAFFVFCWRLNGVKGVGAD